MSLAQKIWKEVRHNVRLARREWAQAGNEWDRKFAMRDLKAWQYVESRLCEDPSYENFRWQADLYWLAR